MINQVPVVAPFARLENQIPPISMGRIRRWYVHAGRGQVNKLQGVSSARLPVVFVTSDILNVEHCSRSTWSSISQTLRAFDSVELHVASVTIGCVLPEPQRDQRITSAVARGEKRRQKKRTNRSFSEQSKLTANTTGPRGKKNYRCKCEGLCWSLRIWRIVIQI